MKKFMFIIVMVIFMFGLTSCVITYDTIEREDIKKYCEDEYQITEWFTAEYNISDEEFLSEYKDEFKYVIDNFEEPQSHAFAKYYRSGHFYFMLIGKDVNGNYKHIIYNVHVKKGTEIKDAVYVLDYKLPYTIDNLFDIVNELNNEYYKDIILEMFDKPRIVLNYQALLEGKFESTRSFSYGSQVYEFDSYRISLNDEDDKTVLTLEAKDSGSSTYQTIYTSLDQTRVEKYEITLSDFNDYFTYNLSNQIKTVQFGSTPSYQAVDYFLDIYPKDSVFKYNILVDVILRFTYKENNEEKSAFNYMLKRLNNTNRISHSFSDYDNIQDINQTVEFRDVKGKLYIIKA